MENTRYIKIVIFLTALFFLKISIAQIPSDFDFKKAYEAAKQKGVAETDIDGYVRFLHYDFLSHQTKSKKQNQQLSIFDGGTIYLGGGNVSQALSPNPPTSQNAYCPNAGFEQYNFSGWTGGYGTVSDGATGAPFPNYTQTSATIVNPAGNNVGLTNTQNYHTIMTTPPTNSVHPSVVGYDSIASRVVGTQTISEVPVVNPNGGPASVRLNGAVANYRASKLKYNMALNPNNKNFSISYALVLEDGDHDPNEQPYFSVKITDQNGALVPGCSQYTVTCSANVVNPAHPSYDPLWGVSAFSGLDQILYRKWQTFAFDFSNYPAITSVNVEFYVGGCSVSGHYGYAYVDAECSQGGAVASFCAGSNTSVLTAPAGFSTYQWIGPGGPVTIANGGNSGTATITPVTAGQVFTCNVTAPNGCSSSFQTTVSITSVSITGINSTPSCLNGNSGTANVSPTGSSLGYSYQWLNSSSVQVSAVKNATGLAPGNYSVIVSSPMCGSSTATVNVGVTPPQYYAIPAPFCGSVAWINKPGGSNYKWYTASPLALIAGATSSSLTINSPVAGTQYFLSYTTPSGCKDSIRFTLNQTTGGSISFSNIKNICVGNNNGYAIINLQTTSPGPFSYTVSGASSYSSLTSNTSSIKDSIINLSIGTYTANVFDGQCIYTNTFAVQPFAFTYTLTPQNATICNSGSTTLSVEFCNQSTTTSCGLAASTTNCSGTASIKQVGSGTVSNSNTGMPCVFANFYKNNRHQLLYTANELLAAGITPGRINSIAFQVLSMMPLQNPTSSSSSIYSSAPFNYSIKMKCTSASVLTTAFDNAGLSQVFNGNYTASVGWNTFNFNQDYMWDGTSNILIDICYNLQSYYTSNPIMTSSAVGANRCVYYQSDSQQSCGTTSTGTTSQNRPNIRFGNIQSINPNNFTYSWLPSTGLSSTTSFSAIASPTATTVYTVSVNPLNQTNCAQVQTSTVSIIVPTTPTLTTVNTLCSNASAVTLTASPVGGVWTGSGVASNGLFNPTNAAIGTNNYTYSIGTGTCASTNTMAISVEKFIPSTISNFTSPFCLTSSNFNLQNLALNNSGTWLGNGVVGSVFSPSLAGVGTYTLVYNTNSQPTASLCPSSSSIIAVVNAAITASAVPAGPFCDNFAPQNLNASPAGGVWTAVTVGSIISPQGTFMPNSSLIGANTLLYTITNGACSGTVSLNVNVSKFISAALTSSIDPLCEYESVKNLQNLAQNAGGVWSGNGVVGALFNPKLAGPGTHTISYNTDSNPSGLCPDQAQTIILVNPKPEINALSNIYEGCNPLQVNLYSSTVNSGSAQWNMGDGSALINGVSIYHTYTTPGIYYATVTYTNEAGCKDTTVITNAIVVYQTPDAIFTATPEITTLIDAEILFNNLTSNVANNNYDWDFGGVGNSNQINPTFEFTKSGEYFVTMIATSFEGCKDTAVRKITINPEVVIYVPSVFTVNGDGLNDEFKIFIPPTGIDLSTFEIIIFDRWGKQLFKSNDITNSWKGSFNNSGETLKQDTYVWKITFKDERKRYYEKLGQVLLLKNVKD